MPNGRPNYYKKLNLTNSAFDKKNPTIQFDNQRNRITIVLDSLKNSLEYSFNGRDVDGELDWSDESITLDNCTIGRIWFKTDNSDGNGTPIRIFAWA